MSAINRRTLVSGAAWTAPALAVCSAAPAFAASGCTPQNLSVDFSTAAYVRASASSATYTWPNALGPGVPLVLTIGATVSTGSLSSDALTTAASVGNTSQTGIDLATFGNQVVTYTFSFNYAVANVAYTITDIDGMEEVWVSATPTTTTRVDPTYIGGAGTSASHWYRSGSEANVDNNTSDRGNVKVTYAGPTSQVKVYIEALTAATTRHAFLTQLTLTTICP